MLRNAALAKDGRATERRADVAVIVDPVKIASRLCGIAKSMQIVVCDAIHDAVKGEIEPSVTPRLRA